nr:hypothetical protein [Vibrio metoecus]
MATHFTAFGVGRVFE